MKNTIKGDGKSVIGAIETSKNGLCDMAKLKQRKLDDSYLELIKSFPLRPIETDEEYDKAGQLCVSLAEDYKELSKGQRDYLAVLTDLLGKFEEQWDDEGSVEPRELLAFLMEQNGLGQKDLVPIFGSSSRVSEFLSGKRDLSLPQILKLSKRFNLSPTAFIPQSDDAL